MVAPMDVAPLVVGGLANLALLVVSHRAWRGDKPRAGACGLVLGAALAVAYGGYARHVFGA